MSDTIGYATSRDGIDNVVSLYVAWPLVLFERVKLSQRDLVLLVTVLREECFHVLDEGVDDVGLCNRENRARIAAAERGLSLRLISPFENERRAWSISVQEQMRFTNAPVSTSYWVR